MDSSRKEVFMVENDPEGSDPEGSRELEEIKASPIKTPLKAIRAKCLDCSGGSSHEVITCPLTECTLYPYRRGKHPTRKGRELTDEQKSVIAERFSKARAAKRVLMQQADLF
jgi:hypothetical protein